MDSGRKKHANRVLIVSILLSVIFAIIALGMGVWAHSQVMIFDGVFSLMTTGLTYLSVLGIKFIKKKDFKNYPFGKESFEPLIVVGQYLIIIIVSCINIMNAIQVILEGGNEINPLSGMLYGVISTVFCIGTFLYLKHLAGKHPLPTEELEVEQWRFSWLFSATAFVGFGVAWVLAFTPFASLVSYVDPVLNILITLIFIKTALLSIRDYGKELMTAAPPKEISSVIMDRIEQTNDDYQFSDMVLRLGKIGGQLVIEIDYVIEEDSFLDSIRIQDQLREEISQSLDDLPYDKWLNVNFIGDIKWAD